MNKKAVRVARQVKNYLINVMTNVIYLKRFLVEAFWAKNRIPSLSGLALLPNWTRADYTGQSEL